MRGPAQISSRLRGQFIVQEGLTAPLPQLPEYRVARSLLSANVAACVASDRVATNGPSWVCVSLDPYSVYRYATNAGEAAQLTALSYSRVISAAESLGQPPADAVYVGDRVNLGGFSGVDPTTLYSGRFSSAKARVRLSDGSGQGRTIICDVGGGLTMSYCCTHVGVELLLPDQSVVAPPNGDPDTRLPAVAGMVEDFVVEASMTLTEGAGLNTGSAPKLTIGRRIDPGVTQVFKVPAGAVTLSFIGNPSNFRFQWVGFPTNPAGVTGEVGELRPNAVEGNTLVVPGNARWVELTNTSIVTNSISVIWGLEL